MLNLFFGLRPIYSVDYSLDASKKPGIAWFLTIGLNKERAQEITEELRDIASNNIDDEQSSTVFEAAFLIERLLAKIEELENINKGDIK